MKKHRRGVVWALVIGLMACGYEREPELDHSRLPVPVRTLEGHYIVSDTLMARPRGLTVTDDLLIVTDVLSLAPVQAFDRATGERVGHRGTRGDGPGEYRSPGHPIHQPGDSSVWVFDRRLQRLNRVPASKATWVANAVTDDAAIPFGSDEFFNDLALLGDTGWLGEGFVGSGRFLRISPDGEPLGSVGARLEMPEYPPHVAAQYDQAVLSTRAINGRVVVAKLFAGTAELCDASGRCDVPLETPFPFEASLRVVDSGEGVRTTSARDTRTGYVNVYADEEAIYALFSGRADAAFGRQGSFARFVHVFEWSGALREVWELDRAALAVVVDAAHQRLLTIVHDPTPGVVAYPLGAGAG